MGVRAIIGAVRDTAIPSERPIALNAAASLSMLWAGVLTGSHPASTRRRGCCAEWTSS